MVWKFYLEHNNCRGIPQCNAVIKEVHLQAVLYVAIFWFVRHNILSLLRHPGMTQRNRSSLTNQWSAMVRFTFLASPQPAWNHDRCGSKNCTRYSQRGFLCPFNLMPHLKHWKLFWAFQKLLHMIILLSLKWNSHSFEGITQATAHWIFFFFLIWICQNDLINIRPTEAIMLTVFCQRRNRCRFLSTVFFRADQRRKIAGYGVFFGLNTISPDLPD